METSRHFAAGEVMMSWTKKHPFWRIFILSGFITLIAAGAMIAANDYWLIHDSSYREILSEGSPIYEKEVLMPGVGTWQGWLGKTAITTGAVSASALLAACFASFLSKNIPSWSMQSKWQRNFIASSLAGYVLILVLFVLANLGNMPHDAFGLGSYVLTALCVPIFGGIQMGVLGLCFGGLVGLDKINCSISERR